MTRVTIDAEVRKKLMNFTKPLELCDKAGSVLGKLIPTTPETDPDTWIELTPAVSDEELQRRLNSDEPTNSTQEVIEMIKKLRLRCTTIHSLFPSCSLCRRGEVIRNL